MTGIDREALVRRHNPEYREWNPGSPLSIGNGDFAFTADITGLQTFVSDDPKAVPLCTMSQQGFHRYADAPANPDGLKLRQYKCGSRSVGYMTDPRGQEDLFNRLRINPHRFHLGKIGLYLKDVPDRPEGYAADSTFKKQITGIHQLLDLWSGTLTSCFEWNSRPVRVSTLCHPDMPLLSVRIESPLLQSGDIGLDLRFPYGSHEISGADWRVGDNHHSRMERTGPGLFCIRREMDDSCYNAQLQFGPGGNPEVMEQGPHYWSFTCSENSMEFSILFYDINSAGALPSYGDTCIKCSDHWHRFWTDGAAVSFSGSLDPRAPELERRIVLSQYLLAIQSLGTLPPAETGLTCNSWYGKFHLEMHPWHALHALLWNRADSVESSLQWYREILPGAWKRAVQQGYMGIRWPKMTDPSGTDSPSSIGCLLCWQQPHLILFAEMLYRITPSRKVLEDYAGLIFGTALFMADYLQLDEVNNRYVLGAPVIPAQENHSPEDTLNPLFELEYWRWGLKTAITWKERLDEPVPARWRDTLAGLSACPVDPENPKLYAAHEQCEDSYGRFGTDHPSMLLAFGFLPPQSTEPEKMAASFDAVVSRWKWDTMWGWDFPAMAMTLARLGRRKEAVDVLLTDSPKNTYAENGHNRQVGDDSLPVYLPGNGGLLLAVGMMAAGWDGSEGECPGFPDDGSWTVRWEGLSRYI